MWIFCAAIERQTRKDLSFRIFIVLSLSLSPLSLSHFSRPITAGGETHEQSPTYGNDEHTTKPSAHRSSIIFGHDNVPSL